MGRKNASGIYQNQAFDTLVRRCSGGRCCADEIDVNNMRSVLTLALGIRGYDCGVDHPADAVPFDNGLQPCLVANVATDVDQLAIFGETFLPGGRRDVAERDDAFSHANQLLDYVVSTNPVAAGDEIAHTSPRATGGWFSIQ